jgi:putative ribosome biogenesis GTPase RsgA
MPNIAEIDRGVEVIEGSADQRASIRRISDLRPVPFVVLLGEPGIGKSTVLDVEAAREGAPVLKVRKLETSKNCVLCLGQGQR